MIVIFPLAPATLQSDHKLGHICQGENPLSTFHFLECIESRSTHKIISKIEPCTIAERQAILFARSSAESRVEIFACFIVHVTLADSRLMRRVDQTERRYKGKSSSCWSPCPLGQFKSDDIIAGGWHCLVYAEAGLCCLSCFAVHYKIINAVFCA